MFEKILKKYSWADVLVSLVFLIFGILLIARPEATIAAIATVLGTVFIVMGIIKLIEYIASNPKDEIALTIALLLVIFGIIIFFGSSALLSFLGIILGIWTLIVGILNFQTTVVWKNFKSFYWILALVFSILMIVAGIILIVNQNIAYATIGTIIVVYAVLDIIDKIIFIKEIDDYIE